METTGPDTAMYRVTFNCSTLHSAQIEGDESENLTISLRGELTAHRLDLSDG